MILFENFFYKTLKLGDKEYTILHESEQKEWSDFCNFTEYKLAVLLVLISSI